MLNDEITKKAEQLLSACQMAGLMVATAESCTGGLIAGALTEIAGSSAVVERGFVTYSNEAKNELLGVPLETIQNHGAVSRETAIAMAEGALANAPVDVTVAVTGVAGPGGGSPEKPVGTVQIASAHKGKSTVTHEFHFDGDRVSVREQTVIAALDMMMKQVSA